MLVASLEYISLFGQPATPTDLVQHNCIVYTARTANDTWQFSRDDSKFSVPVSGAFRSNSAETIFEFVCSGGGIGQLPLWMVTEQLHTDRQVPLLSGYQTETLPFNFVYPKNRFLPLKVRCFIDFVKDKLDTKNQ